jgi:hypothetical protein
VTRATLLRSVLSVMAFLAALLALAIYSQARATTPGDIAAPFWIAVHGAIKDFTGLFIAIPGAWLAYCFSRRSAFLTILDGLWRNMVDAKGKCVRFGIDPTRDRLDAARTALSTTIDNMRSVYRNVGESETDVGTFPFEPLHDMRRTLELYARRFATAPADALPALQQEFRAMIGDSWHALRCRFLKEFGAPLPADPITTSGFKDPRRQRRGPVPPSTSEAWSQASSSTSQ